MVNLKKLFKDFDAYVKKLTFDRALKLFLFAINDETNSLRHLDNQLVNPKLRKAIGVDEISYSQLSRAIRALDSSVLMEIFFPTVIACTPADRRSEE
ncbi:MAG: hypothetical protein LRY37_05610 [Alkalibacterium thalassium]|nr:hypothetical protein [Alkalibacterium thalassium]